MLREEGFRGLYRGKISDVFSVKSKDHSNLPCTLGSTPNRVKGGEAYLRGLMPVGYTVSNSEEMLQQRQAVGNAVSGLTW